MRLTVGAVYFYVIIFILFYLFQLSGDQQFEGGFLLGHVSFDEVDSWFSVVLCHEFLKIVFITTFRRPTIWGWFSFGSHFFWFSHHRSCLCSAWGGRRWRCLKTPNWPSQWRVRRLEAWRGKCCLSALLRQTTSARPRAVSSPQCATSPMWNMAARKRACCWRIPEGARALLRNCWIRLVGEDLGPWAAVGFTGLFCRTARSGNWGGFGYVDSCRVYRSDDTELLD